MLDESALFNFKIGLHEFFFSIHDNGAAPGHGLAQGSARHQHKAAFCFAAFKGHGIPLAQQVGVAGQNGLAALQQAAVAIVYT